MYHNISPADVRQEYEERVAAELRWRPREFAAQDDDPAPRVAPARGATWARVRAWLTAARVRLEQRLQPVEDAGYIA